MSHYRIYTVLILVIALCISVGTLAADDVDDFDPGLNGSMWALIQNGEVAPNPCGFVTSPNALQMYIGPDTKRIRALIPGDGIPPRIAETVPLNVSGGGSIEFDFVQPTEELDKRFNRVRFGVDSDCEESDEDEQTTLQYSTNGGSTWTTILVIPLSSSYDFEHFSISIPAAAQTESTAFRWIQTGHDGGEVDVWALDNVVFSTGGSDSETLVGPPCNNLFDGRINDNQAFDCAAPVAIYYAGDANGRIDVYAIDPNDGDGVLVISVPVQIPEATPTGGEVEPSGNFLLGSAVNPATGARIDLYWLPTTGEYLLLTTYANGKAYEVAWSIPDDLRHITA